MSGGGKPEPGSTAYAVVVAGLGFAAVLAIAQIDYERGITNSWAKAGMVLFVVAVFMASLSLLRRWLPRGWRQAIAAGAITAVVIGAMAAWVLRPQVRSWALVELRTDAIVIRTFQGDGACFPHPHAQLTRQVGRAVTIRVTARPTSGCSDRDCAIDPGMDPRCHLDPTDGLIVVPLDAPLRGERITGPKKLPIFAGIRYRSAPGGEIPRTAVLMPRVVGMAPADARAVIGSGERRLGVVDGLPADGHGYVVAQDPAPGAVVRTVKVTELDRRWSRAPIHLTVTG